MKYQYVTILSHCHLTKHDTILSKLEEPVVLTKDMNRQAIRQVSTAQLEKEDGNKQ